MAERRPEFETRAVQAGLRQDADFRSTAPPIYPSTTYSYDTAARTHAALDPLGRGFAYSRNGNPTVRALEDAIASLEETEDAVAFASGMAAIHAAILATGVRPGQTILAAQDLYGVSRTLLAGLFSDLGFALTLVDPTDIADVDRAFRETSARLMIFEPVSNPLLRVPYAPGLIDLAHMHGGMVIVDNTFASPYLFRPALLGADIVVESATKYLGGHGDVMAGVAACDVDLARVLRTIRTASGGILGPFEAWLVLRGLRTLGLRVRQHCENAHALAEWLSERPEIRRVHYPGRSDHAGHEAIAELFRDGLAGGMVAFETDFTTAHVEVFLDTLSVAVPGTSLGDVETLVLHPASSSHRTLRPSERAAAGIEDGLLRVSVGLEHVADIFHDFDTALSAAAVYTPSTRPP
ncbi:MAG TPA: PLP-dependent aspartate aminotransferase family protein [Chloroflexota bacterium]|jgi:cystathionine gamma-synthase/methionine-gamma-lyase|nr:PLP-dependent aspartate aminotransferase family protein [Chloroflexota bacterium]